MKFNHSQSVTSVGFDFGCDNVSVSAFRFVFLWEPKIHFGFSKTLINKIPFQKIKNMTKIKSWTKIWELTRHNE